MDAKVCSFVLDLLCFIVCTVSPISQDLCKGKLLTEKNRQNWKMFRLLKISLDYGI